MGDLYNRGPEAPRPEGEGRMGQAVEGPNGEVNLQMCPCPAEHCERKGMCGLCIEHHLARDEE